MLDEILQIPDEHRAMLAIALLIEHQNLERYFFDLNYSRYMNNAPEEFTALFEHILCCEDPEDQKSLIAPLLSSLTDS